MVGFASCKPVDALVNKFFYFVLTKESESDDMPEVTEK